MGLFPNVEHWMLATLCSGKTVAIGLCARDVQYTRSRAKIYR